MPRPSNPPPRQIAETLYRQLQHGFPKEPGGESRLTGYEWIKLVQEQTGLSFQEADELALEVAPEFTIDFWEARLNL